MNSFATARLLSNWI